MELGLSRRLGLVLTRCLVQYLDDNIQLAVQGSRDIPCRYVQHVIVSCQNTVYLIKVVFSIPGDCLLVVEAIVPHQAKRNNHFRSSNFRHIPDITEAFIYSVQTSNDMRPAPLMAWNGAFWTQKCAFGGQNDDTDIYSVKSPPPKKSAKVGVVKHFTCYVQTDKMQNSLR